MTSGNEHSQTPAWRHLLEVPTEAAGDLIADLEEAFADGR
jgi:hypothetical protein